MRTVLVNLLVEGNYNPEVQSVTQLHFRKVSGIQEARQIIVDYEDADDDADADYSGEPEPGYALLTVYEDGSFDKTVI